MIDLLIDWLSEPTIQGWPPNCVSSPPTILKLLAYTSPHSEIRHSIFIHSLFIQYVLIWFIPIQYSFVQYIYLFNYSKRIDLLNILYLLYIIIHYSYSLFISQNHIFSSSFIKYIISFHFHAISIIYSMHIGLFNTS